MENNASGTTQAAHANQGPTIYHPLICMDRSGTKSYHLLNHLSTTHSLAGPSGPPCRPASSRTTEE